MVKLKHELIANQIPHKLTYSADNYVEVLPHDSDKDQAVTFVLDKHHDQVADGS